MFWSPAPLPKHEATVARKAAVLPETLAAGGVEHVAPGAPAAGPGTSEHAPLDCEHDLVVEEDEIIPPPPAPASDWGTVHKRYRDTSGLMARGRGRSAGQYHDIAAMDAVATVREDKRKRKAATGGGLPSTDVTEPVMTVERPEPIAAVEHERQPDKEVASQRSPSPAGYAAGMRGRMVAKPLMKRRRMVVKRCARFSSTSLVFFEIFVAIHYEALVVMVRALMDALVA